MLLRAILLLRDSTRIQLLPEIKPFLGRHFASFTRQSIKRRFAGPLKRRWRNLLVVTLIGTGTVYGYRAYRHNQWYNEMVDSDQTLGTKHRIVVLGTGRTLSKKFRLLFEIDVDLFEVGAQSDF
jgi:hypothetical protein